MTESNEADVKKTMSDLSTETTKESAVASPKKKAARKAVKKATKKSAKANGAADDQVALSDLAKDYKLKPSKARRILRAGGVKNEGRWSFKKGSNELKNVEKLLAAAASAD